MGPIDKVRLDYDQICELCLTCQCIKNFVSPANPDAHAKHGHQECHWVLAVGYAMSKHTLALSVDGISPVKF